MSNVYPSSVFCSLPAASAIEDSRGALARPACAGSQAMLDLKEGSAEPATPAAAVARQVHHDEPHAGWAESDDAGGTRPLREGRPSYSPQVQPETLWQSLPRHPVSVRWPSVVSKPDPRMDVRAALLRVHPPRFSVPTVRTRLRKKCTMQTTITAPIHPPPAVASSRRAALRFVRTIPGTYLAIAGEVGRRARYTVTGHGFTWRAEQSRWVPGLDWVVVASQTFKSRKAGQQWCGDAARQDGTLASLAVAARTDGGTHQPR
jgi:hypothetical protein